MPRDVRRNPGGPLAMADPRLDQEFCARGFIRAAQYLANMLASADVLAESRELVRGTFLPDLVCVCRPAQDGERCPECLLGEGEIAMLRRAVRQVVETGFMAMEDLGGPSRMTCVVLPVTVRGRTETAMVIGYRSAPALPPHALEALLGVVGLVGAALARQQADRELVLLAEERAARAVAEVTERRAQDPVRLVRRGGDARERGAARGAAARRLVCRRAARSGPAGDGAAGHVRPCGSERR